MAGAIPIPLAGDEPGQEEISTDPRGETVLADEPIDGPAGGDLESLMSDASSPVPTDDVDMAARDGAAEAEPDAGAAQPDDTFPDAPQFGELPPPPPPPELSNDPAENTRRMVQWQRDLVAHHNEVTNRQVALNEFTAKVHTAQGAQQARIAAQKAEAIKQENQQAAERRARAQAAIDAAVKERLESKRDLESFKWENPHDGRTISALIGGGLFQGLGNAAAIQAGQAPRAQNEVAVAIDTRMKRDYEAKKAKYMAAGDALLMAKYGVKTAEDAHRAAMNDLNADFAARYKLIADQAESVLKQQGVPAEQAKGNALVTGALQEAAKQEAQIHDREEVHRDQRAQAAATLALARANLGERKYEFDAREARERAEAEAKKKAAGKGATGTEAETKSANFNLYKEHANWIADNASKLPPADRDRINAIVQSNANDLARGAKSIGALFGVDQEKGLSPLAKEYLGHMREAADGYGRIKSGGAINKDEEARFMDQFVVKPSDTPADIKARAANIRQNIRLLSPLDKSGNAEPAAAPAAGGLSETQAATLIDHLRSQPNDPRTPAIKAKLRAAGYKVP